MRSGNLGLLIGACLVAPVTEAGPTWKYVITDVKVTDLHAMQGKESVAYDINDLGEIVGWSDVRGGFHHGVLWRNGNMEDVTPYEGYVGEARGINNLTEVVGFMRPGVQKYPHAFHWDARTGMNLLITAYATEEEGKGDPNCATAGDAKAINDSGTITGTWFGSCYPPEPDIGRAARWPGWWAPWEEIVPIGPSSRSNYATNINAAGDIVGWDKDYFENAFHWSQGLGWDAVPWPSGIAPNDVGEMKAFGNNDDDRVVGTAPVRDPISGNWSLRAFFWNGIYPDSSLLPTLKGVGDTEAFEINNQSFSVGYSDNRDRWAVIWHGHFGVWALDMPPGAGNPINQLGKHCEALAVNNRNAAGLIQAVGFCDVGGDRHAMLWEITTAIVPIS